MTRTVSNPAYEAVMACTMAQIANIGTAKRARKARIDTDHRIIARRAALAALTREYEAGMEGARIIFADMADGSQVRRSILNKLILVRIELVEGFPNHARKLLRDIATMRRQRWSVTCAEPGLLVLAGPMFSEREMA